MSKHNKHTLKTIHTPGETSLQWGRFLALCLALLWSVVSCSSDETMMDPDPPPTPAISAVSDTVLTPGDTLTLVGNNFATTPTSNRVEFNNDLARATPLLSTGDSLVVVVPRNANSGPLHVTSLGVNSNTKTVEIQRAIGDVWVMGEGSSFDFKLPTSSSSDEYLVVPFAASTNAGANFTYSISVETATAYPAPPGGRRTSPKASLFAFEFERHIRESTIDYISKYTTGDPSPRRAARRPAQPDTTTFRVLMCTGCSTTVSGNFVTITAALVYEGTNALIYADTSQSTGGFVQADYDALGMQFDTQIFPADTMSFGPTTDVDGDGRATILFTPEVNKLTPAGTAQTSGFISGFFLFNDLAPNLVPSGTSNGQEIFYAMIPDPSATFGNTFTKALVLDLMPGTLAHEFEHMISFGYRFVNFGLSALQVTWLEEGMAHIAEDLNGFDDDNIARADLFLDDPGAISIVSNDASESLVQRGGIFLFLRYLGDRFGEAIYKEILQSPCIGRACIENVTGEDFFDTTADFFAALYLSNRGITSDATYNFTSLDMQNDFASGLAVQTDDIDVGPFGGSIRGSSAEYLVLSGIDLPAALFTVTGSASGRTRVVITRTQ